MVKSSEYQSSRKSSSSFTYIDVTIRSSKDEENVKLLVTQIYTSAREHAPVDPGTFLVHNNKKPGFMFWSVVVSPLVGHIVVWDTASRVVESRDLKTLEVKWTQRAWNADCLTVAADRGHVYFSDYSQAPAHANAWMSAIGNFAPADYNKVNKFLLVADTLTGSLIANVTVATSQKMRISMIIPGAHNDVFLGTSEGLVRVYI